MTPNTLPTSPEPDDWFDRGALRWLPFAALLAIYALALPIDPIDVDSAQYGRIAQEMLQLHSYLAVHNRGGDYLDKPPLTFWLAALSYGIFGISTWAYKLPSLLCAVLGIVSTYRLTRLYYPARTAWTAALMLASCLAMFLWTNDVRTDTVLMGSVAFALWQLARHRVTGDRLSFCLGWVGVGVAMLAKGPIGAMVPIVGVAGDAALKRDWRWLLSPRWFVGAAICLVVLSPMMWGLAHQFGPRGLKFFFWTQSFGRITGESAWHDNTTPLFFTHTLLWELLPWTPLFVLGLFVDAGQLVRSRFRLTGSQEGVTVSGFLLPFAALSLSHYKLPHYLFVIVPVACIIAARQLDRAADVASGPVRFRSALGLQVATIAGLWFAMSWIARRAFPLPIGALALGLVAAALATVAALAPRISRRRRLILPTLATALACGLLMNGHFYPTVIQFQAASVAGHLALAAGAPRDRIFTYHLDGYSLDFVIERHAPLVVTEADIRAQLKLGDVWLFTDSAGRNDLVSEGIPFKEIGALPGFWVSRMSLNFLRPETRPRQLRTYYLLRARL